MQQSDLKQHLLLKKWEQTCFSLSLITLEGMDLRRWEWLICPGVSEIGTIIWSKEEKNLVSSYCKTHWLNFSEVSNRLLAVCVFTERVSISHMILAGVMVNFWWPTVVWFYFEDYFVDFIPPASSLYAKWILTPLAENIQPYMVLILIWIHWNLLRYLLRFCRLSFQKKNPTARNDSGEKNLTAINLNNNSPLTFPSRLSSALFLHFNQHARLSSDRFSGAYHLTQRPGGPVQPLKYAVNAPTFLPATGWSFTKEQECEARPCKRCHLTF